MTRSPRPRGPYQERTLPIRVPLSLLPAVRALLAGRRNEKAPLEAAPIPSATRGR